MLYAQGAQMEHRCDVRDEAQASVVGPTAWTMGE